MAIPGSVLLSALVVTFLPIPIIFGYEILRPGPSVILCGGVAVIAVLPLIPKAIVREKRYQRLTTLLQYLSIFFFATTVDLLLALGIDGYLKNMMAFYIAEGERYFETAYGIVICYWDGIAHCAMCWIMLKLYADGRPMQHVALYWCGSILHSMVVLLLGSIAGSYEIRLPVILNIPYCIVPVVLVAKRLDDGNIFRGSTTTSKKPRPVMSGYQRSPLLLLMDILFAVFFVVAIIVACIRGLAALGCQKELTVYYATSVEPYISHHTAYPKIQMVTYLFQFLPYYMAALCGLVKPQGNSWMVDWSLIHAGAAAQAQVGHILPQFHWRFDEPSLFTYSSNFDRYLYWAINLSLLIIPQMFALRCFWRSDSFSSSAPKQIKGS